MCSDSDPSVASIRQAIDDLAAASRGEADVAELAHRLDMVWAMVAQLDPALAQRLAAYLPEAR